MDEVAARLHRTSTVITSWLPCGTAGDRIETLTGQSFGPAKQNTVSVTTFGLPFVELPGLMIGSLEGAAAWPIPNPVDQQRATVVQVAEFKPPGAPGMPIASALRIAGDIVHAVTRAGWLSRDYMVYWLGR